MIRQLRTGDELATYRLERRLGVGAFAEVWLATEEGAFGFRKQVALKVLKEDRATDEHFRALVNEARVCGYLHHPHIVDVYGVAEQDGLRFIAMEYVNGVPMDRLLAAGREAGLDLPPSVVVDIGSQIAKALDHAHRATDDARKPLNLVHRDLKPANVLLARRGGAKVTDFGIAKASTAATETATGVLKGTPCYVAPEIWRGSREFLPRVDLFALGAMLWEMVVGRRLMDGEGIPLLVGQALHGDADEEIQPLADRFPALAPTVRRMIEREPERRVQTAREVELALQEIRRQIPAPGELDVFLDLFHAAMGEPLPEDLTIPDTGHPSWSRLIEAARSGSRPLPSVFDFNDETADLPSDDGLGGAPRPAPLTAAGATSGYEDTAAPPGDSAVPTPGQTAGLGALVQVEPPRTGLAPPQVDPTRNEVSTGSIVFEPATGTESVIVATRLQGRTRPRRWPLALLGITLLLVGSLAVWSTTREPGGADEPQPAPTVDDARAEPGVHGIPGSGQPAGEGEEQAKLDPAARAPATGGQGVRIADSGALPEPAVAHAPAERSADPAPTPSRTPVPEATPTAAPEPATATEDAPTTEPTPEVVAASSAGCVVFQSTPTGADVCIDGVAAGLRARTGTSSHGEFPDGTLRVGMGIGGECVAETTVEVRSGAAFFVRCDVAAKNTCTVRIADGGSCDAL